MRIPVIRKLKNGDEEFEVHMLDLADIWYVGVENKREIVYHTKDEIFYHPATMEQILAVLKMHGFEKLDRGIVVNLKNIKHFDEEFGKVFFEEQPTKDSKFATIAFLNIKKLKQLLGFK